jgi:hypothetical protein
MVTTSRVAYLDLFGHRRLHRDSVTASNALTCPDDIFGKRRVIEVDTWRGFRYAVVKHPGL